jgi:hypothetical protein
MATLDFPFVQDDMLSGEKLGTHPLRLIDRLAGPGTRPAQAEAMERAASPAMGMQDEYRRIYSLLDGNRIHATTGLPAVSWQNAAQRGSTLNTSVQSVTTTDYAEFVLQLLDKNSFLSSIMIVCAYILIFRAL